MRETTRAEANGEQPRAKRQMDLEIQTMGRLQRILDGLDPETRARVGRWLASRYGERPPQRQTQAQPGA
jgi:hypothetical protein